MEAFSELTKESLKLYIYCLVDPRDEKIFYIGKGSDDRVFQHSRGLAEKSITSEKIDLIKDIIQEGKAVQYYILKHGIDKDNQNKAYEFESFLIEFMEFQGFAHHFTLSNIQGGYNSLINGIQTVEELEAIYGSTEVPIEYFINSDYKLLIININKTKSYKSLYDATRSSWKLSESRVKNVDFVLSEYHGVVRAIYKPTKWQRTANMKRLEFEGYEVNEGDIYNYFIYKKIPKKIGNQNPIRYINL